jgi:hypothetical protein
MSDKNKAVNLQVTDAVTQTSNHVLGLGPATAAINAYLGQAQAQAVLAANMVSQQQQLAMTSMTTTMRNVAQLLGSSRSGGGAAARKVTAQAYATTGDFASPTVQAAAAPTQTDDSSPFFQRPVVT